MSGRAKAAAVMVGLFVVSGVSAPTAAARPTCQDTESKTICQTNGSVSIKARPGILGPPANAPHLPWLGQPGRRRG